jgi:hypothetical protein
MATGHDLEEFVGVVRRYGADAANVRTLVDAANRSPEISKAGIGHVWNMPAQGRLKDVPADEIQERGYALEIAANAAHAAPRPLKMLWVRRASAVCPKPTGPVLRWGVFTAEDLAQNSAAANTAMSESHVDVTQAQ